MKGFLVFTDSQDQMASEFEIKKLPLLIGREQPCDIILAYNGISRVHAEIIERDDQLWIIDKGSSNGLLVRGQKVQEAQINEADPVQLGDLRMEFRSPSFEERTFIASRKDIRAPSPKVDLSEHTAIVKKDDGMDDMFDAKTVVRPVNPLDDRRLGASPPPSSMKAPSVLGTGAAQFSFDLKMPEFNLKPVNSKPVIADQTAAANAQASGVNTQPSITLSAKIPKSAPAAGGPPVGLPKRPPGMPQPTTPNQAAVQPLPQPTSQAPVQPLNQPVNQAVNQSSIQPAPQLSSQPISQPNSQPISQPISQSGEEPKFQPLPEDVSLADMRESKVGKQMPDRLAQVTYGKVPASAPTDLEANSGGGLRKLAIPVLVLFMAIAVASYVFYFRTGGKVLPLSGGPQETPQGNEPELDPIPRKHSPRKADPIQGTASSSSTAPHDPAATVGHSTQSLMSALQSSYQKTQAEIQSNK